MPMLIVMSKFCCIVVLRFSANSVAVSFFVWGNNIMNSSPPYLQVVYSFGVCVVINFPSSRSIVSPALWPFVSLYILKLSMSNINTVVGWFSFLELFIWLFMIVSKCVLLFIPVSASVSAVCFMLWYVLILVSIVDILFDIHSKNSSFWSVFFSEYRVMFPINCLS